MRWVYSSTTIPQTIDDVLSSILSGRQVDEDSRERFFSPLHPTTFSLEDVGISRTEVEKVRQRLQHAKARGEKVVVFGDYDADGVSSTAVMVQTLHRFGIDATAFIPIREKHGYGMTDRSLSDVLAQQKPDLIITVDNGIVAHEAVKFLNSQGVDVIITDHHVPEMNPEGEYIYPEALAIIHSTKLCGATVAWMLSKELVPDLAEELLDLCGIATVADQMTLLGINRSFAKYGIEALRKTKRIGLQQLYQIAGIIPATITSQTINFGIAPRINATGRLSAADLSLRLLLTESQAEAAQLAISLQDTNVNRQDLTQQYLQQALAQADEWREHRVIVVASPEYHEGVIGLIAGKLVEAYAKPAIVISVGEKFAKASARSVPGVNIVELIRKVRHHLIEVGGHPMAAGFGMSPGKIEEMKSELQALALQEISEEALIPSLAIECQLPFDLLSLVLAMHLQSLEPLGNGNREPLFALEKTKIIKCFQLGKEGKHLKLSLQGQSQNGGSYQIEAIAFGMGDRKNSLAIGQLVDVAGYLRVNEWNGRKSVQMVVKDVRESAG